MNPYEIMLLLDAELAEERQNEILTRIRELVEKRGGSWQSDDAWGRRKLAFEIDKKTEAFYYLLVIRQRRRDARRADPRPQDHRRRARHMAVRRIPTARTTSQREPSQHHARESTRAVPAAPARDRPGGRVA